MKCCIDQCMMDATMMPVVKKGSVESFVDAAVAQLGVAKDDVLKDEAMRAQVLSIARTMAYESKPSHGCCQSHISDVAKLWPCAACEAMTFVPFRASGNG